ncbi:DNA-pol-phi domain containing protein [Pyrenophora tritici-repentis]|nr:dna polymerase protein [Pyrenophora tritici-repentis]PZC99948.1 DNA-pol-phi domain containing protein [Pyrenophora tritici-repentis]PZD36119.1 DNA-pol-phi domain containing protein [Pyrenophora tritici-repentis]PZD47028.1 DNA-pol-phi domain containing protein [Pyrenophora tritici-repentis]
MANKTRKRERDVDQAEKVDEAPAKRHRPSIQDKVKLSKLYADLAAEDDDVRLEAAKQIIVKFSPESEPAAKDVEEALVRLIKGLCSQRKAARVGFSLTLTELLRQIFGDTSHKIQHLELDVASVIKMVEEKTKAKGNVPGKEKRDHTIGKLFGFKAIMQSSIVVEPELSLDCWNKLLDQVYRMARDIPWLREECGMVLVEAVRSLKGQPKYQKCAEEVLERLNAFKLVSTPEGVAVWLTVQASYPDSLPEGVWHRKDPLAKKERSRLAKILKEDFNKGESDDSKDEATKTGTTNPNPPFTWDLVFSEILRRDEQNKDDSKKTEFPQFWIDTVDGNLFSSSASHERKAWGFKLLSRMIARVPEQTVTALFSPNLMRTLINQSKKEDRFLHSAALAALSSVQLRAEQDDGTAVSIFVALTSKHGSIEFDRITKTRTLDQILASADDKSLTKIVRHLSSLILRPETEEQSAADSRRQAIADLLLNTVKQYKRYEKFNEKVFLKEVTHRRQGRAPEDRKSNWLRETLETLVECAYFVPAQNADTKKMPLPAISDRSRTMFQERLSSCLTKLLDAKLGARSDVALMVIEMIRSKSSKSTKLELAFKADASVRSTMEKGLQSLDAISASGSIAGNELAAEGFLLLYSLTLLQAYNGEGDAVMMLDDLDASYKAFEASRKVSSKKKKTSTSDGQNAFVEIVLSFSGNTRTLFRRIGEEAFSIFASEITAEGLRSLTEILDTEENLEGQKELFNQDDGDAEEGDSGDDNEDESDVEMIDREADDDDASADSDSKLTQFNNMLAMTLQTSKPDVNCDAAEDTSDESDMDDEQMMALDPHLSKIFKERSKTTSKKKEREDAKQNVVQFKSRVLDLLAVYLEKQYSNPLTLHVLLPVLRRTRANANKQTADKASKILKTFLDTRTKRKAPLPKPERIEEVWDLLKGIHEEAKLGNGAKVHADACASASLHVVKVLIGLDKGNYAGVVDVYAETQKEWFADKKSRLQPVLFTQFQNWSLNARQQGK